MTDFPRPGSFDFGAATLHGFNLPGGKSYLFRVAAATAVLAVLIYVLLGGPIISAYVAFFQNLYEVEHSLVGEALDPQVMMTAMQPMMRAAGFMFLISIAQVLLFALAETAIYRNVFKGEDKGWMPLRLGVDEWRVLGTRLVVGLVLFGLYIGLYLLGAIVGFVFFGLANALSSGILAAIGGLLVFALIIAAIIGFVWVAIRLAPSAAYSVKSQSFDPFASWGRMKGRVWPAIGSYLIIYIVGYFLVCFLFMIVLLVVVIGGGIFDIVAELDGAGEELPDLTALWDHMSSLGFIVPVVLGMLGLIFVSMVWYGMIWSMWAYFAKTDHIDNF